MPSKRVGEEFRDIIKNVRDGSFDYKYRNEAETNCAKYDSAQIKEMANYLDNLRDIVDEADYGYGVEKQCHPILFAKK